MTLLQAILLIVNKIAEDWMYLRTDSERNVMIRWAQIARFIVIYGYIMMLFALIMVTVLPLFGLHYRVLTNLTAGAKALPMPGYYFYDTDKSPQFEFTLIAQTVSTMFGILTFILADAFLVLIIFHICGQLENFRYRLHNLISGNNFTNALRSNVKTHLRLIRFVDNMEHIFTVLMLILLFYFNFVFCLFSYTLVTVTTDEGNKSFSQISYSIIGVIWLLTQTFFYCGGGQLIEKEWLSKMPFLELFLEQLYLNFVMVFAKACIANYDIFSRLTLYVFTLKCEAVYRALCDLEWHKWKPRESRTLILLMIQANEPFHLTAGKIFPLSMATFCSVLKTSVGYISFLLAKRN